MILDGGMRKTPQHRNHHHYQHQCNNFQHQQSLNNSVSNNFQHQQSLNNNVSNTFDNNNNNSVSNIFENNNNSTSNNNCSNNNCTSNNNSCNNTSNSSINNVNSQNNTNTVDTSEFASVCDTSSYEQHQLNNQLQPHQQLQHGPLQQLHQHQQLPNLQLEPQQHLQHIHQQQQQLKQHNQVPNKAFLPDSINSKISTSNSSIHIICSPNNNNNNNNIINNINNNIHNNNSISSNNKPNITTPSRSTPPRCYSCWKLIEDEYYLGGDEEVCWHMSSDCLKCQECGLVLEHGTKCFVLSGSIYCSDDYKRLGSRKKCKRCDAILSDLEMVMCTKLNDVYHVKCFSCVVCHVTLTAGQQYGIRNGDIHCGPHFEAVLSSAGSSNTFNPLPFNSPPATFQSPSSYNNATEYDEMNKTQAACAVVNDDRDDDDDDDNDDNYENAMDEDWSSDNNDDSSCVFTNDFNNSGELGSLDRQSMNICSKSRSKRRKLSGDVSSFSNNEVVHQHHHHHSNHAVLQHQLHSQHSYFQFNNDEHHHMLGLEYGEQLYSNDLHYFKDQLLSNKGNVAGNNKSFPCSGYVSSNNQGSNNNGSNRQKRLRTSFKHHQLRTMKTYFNINHNPDAKDLKDLAHKTGLTKRVLQVWFQNARAKYRRNIMKQDSGKLSEPAAENNLPSPSSVLEMNKISQNVSSLSSSSSPCSVEAASIKGDPSTQHLSGCNVSDLSNLSMSAQNFVADETDSNCCPADDISVQFLD